MTVSLISVGQKIDGANEHAYMMTKSQAALAVRGYCVPEGATVHQAADLYCKYLGDNPAQRQLTAAGLLSLALKAGWPCR
jgi:Rap1a immunity proteins